MLVIYSPIPSQLCDIKVEVRWKPLDITWESTNHPGYHSILPLNLAFLEGYCLLQTIQGEDVAVLNKATSVPFQEAMGVGSIEFQAFVTEEGWKLTNCMKAGVKSVVMTVGILMYGLRAVSSEIARIFAKFEHFLQCPLFDMRQLPYENPQDIDLSAFDSLTIQSVNHSSAAAQSNELLGEVASSQRDLDNYFSFDDFFDDRHQELYSALASPSMKVKTELLL